ncbi:hypothetical protein [Candidatus Cardinium hertigii]|jgi:hypothetical protein|uniref:Uncharacterized protein n=1 Tax=Candidatus Cardinium hertigii TaxID=247481 RepID=A0A3N2QD38_9BACT|nr:hypothetical protein [Candidatus Cardinium hertigii]ROT47705.1 hypothetical protein EDM02_00840 [Candidatus Cardinium hertigii]
MINGIKNSQVKLVNGFMLSLCISCQGQKLTMGKDTDRDHPSVSNSNIVEHEPAHTFFAVLGQDKLKESTIFYSNIIHITNNCQELFIKYKLFLLKEINERNSDLCDKSLGVSYSNDNNLYSHKHNVGVNSVYAREAYKTKCSNEKKNQENTSIMELMYTYEMDAKKYLDNIVALRTQAEEQYNILEKYREQWEVLITKKKNQSNNQAIETKNLEKKRDDIAKIRNKIEENKNNFFMQFYSLIEKLKEEKTTNEIVNKLTELVDEFQETTNKNSTTIAKMVSVPLYLSEKQVSDTDTRACHTVPHLYKLCIEDSQKENVAEGNRKITDLNDELIKHLISEMDNEYAAINFGMKNIKSAIDAVNYSSTPKHAKQMIKAYGLEMEYLAGLFEKIYLFVSTQQLIASAIADPHRSEYDFQGHACNSAIVEKRKEYVEKSMQRDIKAIKNIVVQFKVVCTNIVKCVKLGCEYIQDKVESCNEDVISQNINRFITDMQDYMDAQRKIYPEIKLYPLESDSKLNFSQKDEQLANDLMLLKDHNPIYMSKKRTASDARLPEVDVRISGHVTNPKHIKQHEKSCASDARRLITTSRELATNIPNYVRESSISDEKQNVLRGEIKKVYESLHTAIIALYHNMELAKAHVKGTAKGLFF